jgi:hypothetical protein
MDEQVKRGPGRPRKDQVGPTYPANDPVIPAVLSGGEGADPERSGMVMIMPEQSMIEPQIAPPPEVEIDVPQTEQDEKKRRDLIEKWRWLRGRVKRIGGWVANLGPNDKKRAEAMLQELGRKVEQGWDMTVLIAGYDNTSHQINQRHLKDKNKALVNE